MPRGPLERQIDVISGGSAVGDSSMTARKAYARSTMEKRSQPEHEPKITFEAGEVERSHHDDVGSSADVLYFDAFGRLGLTQGDLTPATSALTGFTGDSISPLGTTVLPITIGEEPREKTVMTTFMVVDLLSAYNVILDRPTLNRI